MTDRKDGDAAGALPQAPAANEAQKPQKSLSPAAARALAEATERRAAHERTQARPPTELAGRGGLDPARYGDWEVKGLASDF